jgi:type IV pilus assembly protein PilW
VPQQAQSGFSLVELMIAAALGIIIVAWLTQVFTATARVNREMANTNDLIERGRFAVDRLSEDVSQAGYWGGHIPTFDDLTWNGLPVDLPRALPRPCLAFQDWQSITGHTQALLGVPLQVHTPSPDAGCDAMLGAESDAPGTDVLVVRRADSCGRSDEDCAAGASAALYLQVSNCDRELVTGSDYVLDPIALPLTELDCVTQAAGRRFMQHIYFVRENTRGVPSLYRSAFGYASGEHRQLAAQEWVPGVERLRVGLGLDNRSSTGALTDPAAAVIWRQQGASIVPVNRGDGIPDGSFVYCSEAQPCGVEQLINISAVRIHLLVRAALPSPGHLDSGVYQLGDLVLGPFNDAYKRHVFSSTVRIHNMAARRGLL